MGAAPATSPGSELHGLIVGGSVKADPAYSAAAQPDARDAEIARLTKELEEARARTSELIAEVGSERAWHYEQADKAYAAEAQAKVLREALEFARRLPMAKKNRAILTAALAPSEPKAETRAETAGQKEGPEMARQLPPAQMYCAHFGDDGQCGRTDCAQHECHLGDDCPLPAQPSQDVAGTSGESLAGPSKEGSETP